MKNLNDDVMLDMSETEAKEEEYDTPICMDDILIVCREYSQLGNQLQHQVEAVMEMGIEEAIATHSVSISALPFVKNFLLTVGSNGYFGDAAEQARACVLMINLFEEEHPEQFRLPAN
jgi:hypothetical protein